MTSQRGDPRGTVRDSRPGEGTVSIVVPTHNRGDKLLHLLDSIAAHSVSSIQDVVVVDDSDEPADLEGKVPGLRLDHIKVGRRVFISKAKNIGWKHTSTDFVYFIDDDNVVGDKTFAPLMDWISKSQDIGALMPGILYESDEDLVWVYSVPFLNQRHVLNLVGRNQTRNPSLEGRQLRTDALPDACLVRRDALESVGGFDERLVVNSSLDFTQRLKAAGWMVYSYTGALIYHDVEPPGRTGWWAAHGSVDPDRVRYELRDWFLITKRLHPGVPLFRLLYTLESLRFLVPNLFAYMLRGRTRRALVGRVILGYVEGLKLARESTPGYGVRDGLKPIASAGTRTESGLPAC